MTSANRRAVAALVVLALAAGALLVAALQQKAGAQANDEQAAHPAVQWFPAIIEVPQEDGFGSYAMGSGFTPGQELDVRLMMGGADTSVSWLTSPSPTVANDQGAFVFGFEIPTDYAGLLAHEPTTVRIYDNASQELLATAPLVLCGADEETEEADSEEADSEEAEDVADPWCEIAEQAVAIP